MIKRRGEVVSEIGSECVLDLDKYDRIALMFFNSCHNQDHQKVILSDKECFRYYKIIHRLCSIPGVGSMAYPSGWVKGSKHNIFGATTVVFNDSPEQYYLLEKRLNHSNVYLYQLQHFNDYPGERCFLRYVNVLGDFKTKPFWFKK